MLLQEFLLEYFYAQIDSCHFCGIKKEHGALLGVEWSEVARKAIQEKIRALEQIELLKKSRLKGKD